MTDAREHAARVAQVEAIRAWYVRYDELEVIRQDFARLHRRDNSHGESACMLLHGPTRSGKSKLIMDYVDDHPVAEGPEGDRQEVVYVKAPYPCTTKNLVERIVKVLGHPRPHARSGSQNRGRFQNSPRMFDMMDVLLGYVRDLGVRLMFIDEVHQATRTQQAVLDAATLFKDLINEGEFSLVLAGTAEAKRLFLAHDELEGRLLAVHELQPFDWFDTRRRETFLTFLDAMDRKLPFEERSDLASADMAVRIHAVSGGIIGNVARLVENAGVIAALQGARRILPAHFAAAFAKKAINKDSENPFLGAPPEPRRLDAPPVPERAARRHRGRRGDDDFRP
ncbi:TniB family NTP-binding protein [Azospirillum argentinense]|uniref:TniB family NTP-binding protein n=1 Tax=Azospirillum argentinense TaxID=2970906 RepID=A0ABW8VD37_9PROT